MSKEPKWVAGLIAEIRGRERINDKETTFIYDPYDKSMSLTICFVVDDMRELGTEHKAIKKLFKKYLLKEVKYKTETVDGMVFAQVHLEEEGKVNKFAAGYYKREKEKEKILAKLKKRCNTYSNNCCSKSCYVPGCCTDCGQLAQCFDITYFDVRCCCFLAEMENRKLMERFVKLSEGNGNGKDTSARI
jgi:hypothetical protein